MHVQLIRHATLRVSIGVKTLLVDPMLSDAEAMDPIQNASNDRRIPLVPLPFDITEILKDVDAVLVTHTHRDHWDAAATRNVSKALPIFCQPEDEAAFKAWGYGDIRPVRTTAECDDLQIARTDGQHGTGEIGSKMAPVSGFVLRAGNEPSLYIAGDTIFCPEVEHALRQHEPNVTVVNAGAAQFKTGDPITMTSLDVARVCRSASATRVIAVHMGAINHCLLQRDELAREMKNFHFGDRVSIPEDGETICF